MPLTLYIPLRKEKNTMENFTGDFAEGKGKIKLSCRKTQ